MAEVIQHYFTFPDFSTGGTVSEDSEDIVEDEVISESISGVYFRRSNNTTIEIRTHNSIFSDKMCIS